MACVTNKHSLRLHLKKKKVFHLILGWAQPQCGVKQEGTDEQNMRTAEASVAATRVKNSAPKTRA